MTNQDSVTTENKNTIVETPNSLFVQKASNAYEFLEQGN